ncbi:MAG: hypothetical protein EP349_06285 [Alphaproteobacteria bacterium]|nr:MAG: hypothetical protein EP349_06285 [Alphaproteobacteria bacterium]
MADSLQISLSGLKAQSQRLAAASSNIANLTSSGINPDSQTAIGPEVFKPLKVSQSAVSPAGGTTATISQDENGTLLVFDPSSPFADENGAVAVPNISLEKEITDLLAIKIAYKANALALRTEEEIQKNLIDELS